MTLLEATKHLTNPHTGDWGTNLSKTHKGMAYLGGTGPQGNTCRECKSWQCQGDYYASRGMKAGVLKPARCGKGTGHKIPHFAAACKYFDLADKPPPITKPSAS